MLKPGQVFNNRYKISSTLGQGGFGAVYKVWDDNLQRHCAIKENLQVSPEAQKQFKREAAMLANLSHPHLVRVTDYFIIPSQGQYLVMDYVDGNDLHTILSKTKAPLPVDQSLTWIRQICDSLIYIHNQNPPIIHRDIKPANIRITPQNKAVLVDFGLAKIFDDGVTTTMGARGLTPHFAAPEQYGMGGTDAQSDIYSLGVTLYCLLTNTVPPDSVEIMVGNAEPPRPANTINRNVPDLVSNAVQLALNIRRTERYKSAEDFKIALVPKQKFIDHAVNKITLTNGMEFLLVPVGNFTLGKQMTDNEMSYGSYIPQHIANIPYDYWMGRFPVTNSMYEEFVNETSYKTYEEQHGGSFSVGKGEYSRSKNVNWRHPLNEESNIENKRKHPVVRIDWVDAKEYVKWLNEKFFTQLPDGYIFRIPSEFEWEKAARGTDGRIYPWGNNFEENKCNTNQYETGTTTPVDFYESQSKSPYNCADMFGNVWEWTRSLYHPCPTSDVDGKEDEFSTESVKSHRVLRGGVHYEPRGIFERFNYLPYRNQIWGSIGFRVVISPVPDIVESLLSAQKTANVTKKDFTHYKFALTGKTPSGLKIFSLDDMEFMFIPKGKFIMGSDKHNENAYFKILDESPQHIVDIPYDYYLSRFAVTNLQYAKYCKYKRITPPTLREKEKHPVDGISWRDANDYCKWLNDLHKVQLPRGYGFCLPSEAEWEKAARGTDGRTYPWGNQSPNLNLSNYYGNNEDGPWLPENATRMKDFDATLIETQPVLQNSPKGDSPYGCADMVGNIWEWTRSIGEKTYPYVMESALNSLVISDICIVRGGSYGKFLYEDDDLLIKDIRCTDRGVRLSECTYGNLGFRVALVPLVNYS